MKAVAFCNCFCVGFCSINSFAVKNKDHRFIEKSGLLLNFKTSQPYHFKI